MGLELLRRLTAARLICFSEDAVKLQSIHPVEEHIVQARRVEWARFGQLRIHLLQPNALLDRLAPLTRLLMKPAVVAMGIVSFIAAFILGLSHDGEMGRVLRTFHWGIPQVFTIVALFFLVTCVHELGHAAVCRHFGAPVRSLGVMLYYLRQRSY